MERSTLKKIGLMGGLVLTLATAGAKYLINEDARVLEELRTQGNEALAMYNQGRYADAKNSSQDILKTLRAQDRESVFRNRDSYETSQLKEDCKLIAYASQRIQELPVLTNKFLRIKEQIKTL